MKMTKQFAKCWALAVLASLAVSGCLAPDAPPVRRGGARQLPLRNPDPDGYYTGEQHDFASRPNPDLRGRKFRVAHLHVGLKVVNHLQEKPTNEIVREYMQGIPFKYMMLREQIKDDTIYPEGEKATEVAVRAVCEAWGNETKFIEQVLLMHALEDAGVMRPGRSERFVFESDAGTMEILKLRNDIVAINERLSGLYPNLFSADEDAFPLDIMMCAVAGALPSAGTSLVRTQYEAWLLGLNEHAHRSGIGFSPTESFLDPYEAIAAAVFKLSDEQLWRLEKPNPADWDWRGKMKEGTL